MASKHPKGYWTKERVTDEAQKYVSRNQFRENASAAYIAAKKYGILDVLFVTNGKIVHEAGYWTPERLNEEGRKYQTKGEFKKQSPTAYATAVRNGLIASMDWFIDGRRKKRGLYKKHKYSKDTVAIIIKEYKCITVADLRKANEYAYKEARDNNWLTELGLAENKHEDGYWTPERVWTVAKQYSNKKDFYKNEPVARTWAGKYKMLGKMSWMRCPTYDELRENHDSEVYAFIDEGKKVAYVGLSIDTNQRKRAHKSDKKRAQFNSSVDAYPVTTAENSAQTIHIL